MKNTYSKEETFTLIDSLPPPVKMQAGAFKAQAAIALFSRDDDSRYLFSTLLGIWNYTVEEVETFEALISVGKKTPDVILIDVGISFSEEMKNLRLLRETGKFADVPIVLFSGWTQPQSRPAALANGASEFLVKPLDFDLLEIVLQRFTGSLSRSRRL